MDPVNNKCKCQSNASTKHKHKINNVLEANKASKTHK